MKTCHLTVLKEPFLKGSWKYVTATDTFDYYYSWTILKLIECNSECNISRIFWTKVCKLVGYFCLKIGKNGYNCGLEISPII